MMAELGDSTDPVSVIADKVAKIDLLFDEHEQMMADARQTWNRQKSAAVWKSMADGVDPSELIARLDQILARALLVRTALTPPPAGMSDALRPVSGL